MQNSWSLVEFKLRTKIEAEGWPNIALIIFYFQQLGKVVETYNFSSNWTSFGSYFLLFVERFKRNICLRVESISKWNHCFILQIVILLDIYLFIPFIKLFSVRSHGSVLTSLSTDQQVSCSIPSSVLGIFSGWELFNDIYGLGLCVSVPLFCTVLTSEETHELCWIKARESPPVGPYSN